MSGGMAPRPGSLTLAERSLLSQRGPDRPVDPASQPRQGEADRDHHAVQQELPERERPVGARHCWVTGLPGQLGRWPGLLVAWQRQGAGWFGRVVYGVVDDGQVVLVETWVAAQHLHPADT